MLYIFLDFDGVLHTQNGRRFSLIDNFSQVIKNYPQINIIFSTSWREYSSLDQLKNYFPEYLHKQCVGVTPLIREPIEHVRFHEIQQYIKKHNITEQWLAIDDMAILFPKDCNNLFLVDGKKGLYEEVAKVLEKKIKYLLESSIKKNVM